MTTQLSPGLKEFCALCREGKLFAVQKWIAEGKPFQMAASRDFIGSPLQIAIRSKFHSLVEVLLAAGIDQCEKDALLDWVARKRLLDYVKLLAEHGADHLKVDREGIINDGCPPIIYWFANHGMDLETDWPIARALCRWPQKYLLVYGWLRSRFQTARDQASMALRWHTRQGNLEWVTRLMQAGADPRQSVPEPILSRKMNEPIMGTALCDALCAGSDESLRQFKFSAKRDDVNQLLDGCAFSAPPRIMKMLIDAGADVAGTENGRSLMEALIWRFQAAGSWDSIESAVECLEIAGRAGGRWRPLRIDAFRRTVATIQPKWAAVWLTRLVISGAIEQTVFARLMNTPKMRGLMKKGRTDWDELRKLLV